MIIKKWVTNAWVNKYPKTLAEMIYAADTTSPLFDSSDKLNYAYLPAGILSGMNMVASLDLTTDKSVDDMVTAGLNLKGEYLVVTVTGDIVQGSTNTGTVLAPGDEGDSTYPITLEAGDWIVAVTDLVSTEITLAIINNTHSIATPGAPGIVGVDYATHLVNRNFKVQMSGGNAFVNVPWDHLGLDSVPVEDQEAEAISSGWAFDHAAASDAHPRDQRSQIAGSYAPLSHAHGSITNDGKIGTVANRIVETTTDGLLAVFAKGTAYNKAFGASAGDVCEGDDDRLSDARTPLSHGHGTIGSNGSINVSIAPDDGDQIAITDSNGSHVINRGPTFATVHGSQFLRKDGTWAGVTVEAHAHGDIDTDGEIQVADAQAIGTGDLLMFVDNADDKVKRSTLAFGSQQTQFLRNDGTWQIPANDQRTDEEIEDLVGAMITTGGGINHSYIDGNSQIDIGINFPVIFDDDLDTNFDATAMTALGYASMPVYGFEG